MHMTRRHFAVGALIAVAACAPTGPSSDPRAAHDTDQQNVAGQPHSAPVTQGAVVSTAPRGDGAVRETRAPGTASGTLGGAGARARRAPGHDSSGAGGSD